VAIIMDGNGRWAEARALPRRAGHRAGADAVRRTVSAAAARGIGILTLYAFSSDNWRRPAPEVRHLMRLFRLHLLSEAGRCEKEGIRVNVIGRRDRLATDLVAAIRSIEARTCDGSRLHLQLAVDYSSRDAILEAVGLHHAGSSVPPGEPAPGATGSTPSPTPSREEFAGLVSRALNAASPIPDVDLLIRSGGDGRLSDFMLWECAYAELVFTPRLGPDFGETDLDLALEDFRGRERRFGGLLPGSAARARRGAPAGGLPSRDPSPTPSARTLRVEEARKNG
jgi:undecaprenyl diphosphate synthase